MSDENLVPNLKIVMLSVDDLTPYEKNAKRHTPKQLEQLANSISQFGFSEPIGVYSDDSKGIKNLILSGHGRLEAAKRLGMKEVPCVRLDHMSNEADRRAYTLVTNQLTMATGWDSNILGEELSDLIKFDFDMGDFGFNPKLFSNFSKASDKPKSTELSLASFEEQCAHECPKCGFKYN